MTYRIDEGLEFLQYLTNDELEPLFLILTTDKKADDKRYTESITSSAEYKKYGKDYSKYWELLAEELQRYGGNTLVNVVRQKGVLYKEILCDVCDSLKVNYNKKASIKQIEFCLINKVAEEAIEKMTPAERAQFAKEIDAKLLDLSKEALLTAIYATLKRGGFKTYVIATRLANALIRIFIGKGAPFVFNAVLKQTLKKVITIMPVVTAAWTAIDIASPAYRVTIPAVFYIATARLGLEERNKIEDNPNE